jgi:two-component system sensor histidine kinase GlrK
MKLTIFSRLVIGFFAIFMLAMTVSVYAIIQLRKLEIETQAIILKDSRLTTYEKKLADLLLSQMRYEKKFIITGDDELYALFSASDVEFHRQLDILRSV